MTHHTPEPWATDYRERPDGMFAQEVFDANGETIATLAWFPVYSGVGTTTNREANARRIVACVNACAGLETETLENITMLGETLLDRFELRNKQEAELTSKCEEMLAALEAISAVADQERGNAIEMKEMADAAIAKAKGGAAINKITGETK